MRNGATMVCFKCTSAHSWRRGEFRSLNKHRFGDLASPASLGQSLCIAQIIPLAVSSSTPWRIYA